MVTVVLADDHVVVRQGLRALLESDPRVVIVGEAADGLEAVELVRRRKPTVLIADLMMPGLDGLATTRKLSHLKSDTRVIILSMYGDQAYVLEALKSGAAGYVVKESCGAELFEAIRVVVAGRRYLSPAVSETSIGSYSSMGTILQKAQTGLREVHDKLTVRERKVLQALPFDEAKLRRDLGILPGVQLATEKNCHPYEQTWRKPAVTVIAQEASSIQGASNQVLPKAEAIVSCRIVPDQDPEEVRQQLEAFLLGSAQVRQFGEEAEDRFVDAAYQPAIDRDPDCE